MRNIHIRVDSGPLAARQVFDRLKGKLVDVPLDVEELGAVELVLAEAVNNIVEHAYSNGQRRGAINLSCRLLRDGLHFEITDNGLPMPGGCTPLGRAVNVGVDPLHLPEGGYGWFLIKDLAKDVIYCRRGQVNHLTLRIAVAMGAGGG